jgi:hypothetical protein
MHIKRSLAALAVMAGVAAPLGVAASNAVSAQPTKGPETITGTVYEVGTPASNPTTSVGGGTFKAGGVVVGKGNIVDVPGGNVLLAFSNGTGTFEATSTGGKFTVVSLNPVTCAVVANVTNQKSTIVNGTGIFAAATGKVTVNLLITGTLPRVSTGGCGTAGAPVEDTVQFTASGTINLH